MKAEEYFREGALKEALEDLKAQIRNQPDDSRYRIFYFQLLIVTGDWKRALNQLDVLGDLDAGALPMVHLCRQAIQCEMFRSEVFKGRKQPTIFGEPLEWMALLLESLRLNATGNYDQAKKLRDQAFEQADPSSGTIDDAPFDWIADADSRLGPVLEIIVNGKYFWAPFSRIQAVAIEAPEDLRDFVWLPATFTLVNGGQVYGLIPTRYPGSENAADSNLQLAKTTDWQKVSEGYFHGLGLRMLTTDQDDYPLLNIRNISISSDADAD